MPAPLTPTDLAADVRRLGVNVGDAVMVHASLRAVGPVIGGAAGLVGALELAVGPAGTLLMTIGARDDWAWVNERPEVERPALLAEAEPFDALRTPADPDIGTLAEVFRQLPGTVVSNHPEGRFAARGRLAEALVGSVPWHDYYGPDSPLERLVRLAGKVLRLGADIDTVTLLHYAEYVADVPDKRRVRRYRRVLGPQGPEVRFVDCLDDNEGIVEYSGEDYFGLALRGYLAAGRGARGRVGGATSELLDAGDLVDFAARWMEANLTPAW